MNNQSLHLLPTLASTTTVKIGLYFPENNTDIMPVANNNPFPSLNYTCYLIQYNFVHGKCPGNVTTNAATSSLNIVCPTNKAFPSIPPYTPSHSFSLLVTVSSRAARTGTT